MIKRVSIILVIAIAAASIGGALGCAESPSPVDTGAIEVDVRSTELYRAWTPQISEDDTGIDIRGEMLDLHSPRQPLNGYIEMITFSPDGTPSNHQTVPLAQHRNTRGGWVRAHYSLRVEKPLPFGTQIRIRFIAQNAKPEGP